MEAVLGSTRQSPGVYQEKFRRITKRLGVTYLGLAREVDLKLDRWLKATTSEKPTTSEEIKAVMQMEQFMSQLPLSLKI